MKIRVKTIKRGKNNRKSSKNNVKEINNLVWFVKAKSVKLIKFHRKLASGERNHV